MKKILILGSSGMLGHMVYNYLVETNKFQIIDTSFPNRANSTSFLLDVTNIVALKEYIIEQKADMVINCIGILVKGANENPENAIYINSFLPHLISNLIKVHNGRLIQISTDSVFSGGKGTYLEDDIRDADDIYGRTKALGELNNTKDITLRTSIIGPELKQNGENLFHWFLHQKGILNGYVDSYWSGVTTLELAKVIEYIIETNITGLVHVTNGVRISKYNLLRLIQAEWDKNDIIINQLKGNKLDKSLAKSTKLSYEIPSFKDMLKELKGWMDCHNELYESLY